MDREEWNLFFIEFLMERGNVEGNIWFKIKKIYFWKKIRYILSNVFKSK